MYINGMSDGPQVSPDQMSVDQESASRIPFDRNRFMQIVRLEDKFFDYGLNDSEKEDVVSTLDNNNDILLQAITVDQDRKRALEILSALFGENDNIPALTRYGYSFVERHLPQLESFVISSHNYAQKKEMIDFMIRLSDSESPQQKHLLVSSLQRILKKEMGLGTDVNKDAGRENMSRGYLDSFQKIFQVGSDDQIIESAQTMATAFDTAPSEELKRHVGRVIAHTIWSNKESDRTNLKTQASRELATLVLKSYGLDFSELAKVWGNFSTKTGVIGTASRNIETIIDLEAVKPEIAKTLFQQFKIALFHRYPHEVLVDQFDNRDRTDIPYGIMVSSIADHNEAFSSISMEGFMKSLHSELQKAGFALRVFEDGTEDGLREDFIESNKRYGSKSPKFAIIAGHGAPDQIQMNWENPQYPNRIIRKESFQGQSAWKFTDYMDNNGTLILLSCSTGASNGIAQDISEQGITTSGPDQEAALGGINIDKDPNGLPKIQVWYRGAKTNTYKDGLLVAA